MGRRLAVVAIVIVGAVFAAARADGVSSFTDNFTGTDGVSIVGDSWGYVDLGAELSDWQVYPRTAPNDTFVYSNNSLYAKVAPPEIEIASEYSKVMASIFPKVNGSQVSLSVGANQKAVYEVDLLDTNANDGCKWGLNAQVKLVFTSSAATFNDPNSSFDSFVFNVTARRSADGNELTYEGFAYTGGTVARTTTGSVARPATYPLKLYYTVDSTGLAEFYFNDTTTAIGSVQGGAVSTLHPYLWIGRFNGDGTEVSDGDMTLDNYRVAVEDIPIIVHPGDISGDGKVTDADYTIWATYYNKPVPPGCYDPNGDGMLTDADYTIWADNYGFGVTWGNAVPEPATMSLLGLGLMGLLRRRN